MTRDFQTIWYYPVFMFRRIIFVAIPTLLWFIPVIQLQVVHMMTTFYIMYYSGIRPHIDMRRHHLECFNEVTIMIFCYHLLLFTYFVVDDST